jgi:5S rRNA maturation endonuclease (ribonuclease M5)
MTIEREKYLSCLERYLQYSGIEVRQDGQMRCINNAAHNNGDKNFSAKLYKNEGSGHSRVKCFACDFDGDIYDVVGHVQNEHEFVKQYEVLEKIFGGVSEHYNDTKKSEPEKKPAEKLPAVAVDIEKAKSIYSDENIDRVRGFSKNEITKSGIVRGKWEYDDIDGNIIGIDVRIESEKAPIEGKREKVVSTFWYNGKSLKMSDGPYLIYNLHDSVKGSGKDKPKIIHEGAKCARIANKAFNNTISTAYNRGSQNADKPEWKKYYNDGTGVYILPDNDAPGLTAANKIKGKLPNAIILKTIYKHFEIEDKKGADIEQLLEQASPEEIESYILNYTEEIEREEISKSGPTCLGVSDNGMLFFIDRSQRLMSIKRNRAQKDNLLDLCPLDYWQMRYQNEKGIIIWDKATDDVLEESFSREFDDTKLRGRGAWREDNNFIYHDGKQTHGTTSGEYMYLRKNKRDIGINDAPIEKEKMIWFKKLCEDASFERTSDMIKLLSWSIISPFCGALKFRPGLLLTGESGSGKTTILEKIVVPISNGMHLNAHYTSPAGIRAKTGIDSCAVLLEEAEANQNSIDSDKNQNRNALFSMMRASSSDNSPSGVKSNQEQQAVEYKMKNMFLFVSITPTISDIADDNRILKVNFDNKKVKHTGEERRVWSEVENEIDAFLTTENCRRIHSLAWRMLPKIIEDTKIIIDIMKDKTAGFGKSSRSADAESILISTYINIFHNFEMTRDNIHRFLEKYYQTVGVEEDRNETEELMKKIFDEVVEVSVGRERRKISIKESLDCLRNKDYSLFYPDLSFYTEQSAKNAVKKTSDITAEKEIKRIIGHYGMSLQRDGNLALSKNSDKLKRILNREDGYSKIFHRHKNFVIEKQANINNLTQNAVIIDIYKGEKKYDPDEIDIPF